MPTTTTTPDLSLVTAAQYQYTLSVDGVTAEVPQQRVGPTMRVTTGVIDELRNQSISAAANLDIDLTTAFKQAFATVRAFAVFVTSTAGTVRVGGTVTNGNKLWFTDLSDSSSHTVGGPQFAQGHPSTGVTVDGSNKVVRLHNPGGAAITVTVVAAGTV